MARLKLRPSSGILRQFQMWWDGMAFGGDVELGMNYTNANRAQILVTKIVYMNNVGIQENKQKSFNTGSQAQVPCRSQCGVRVQGFGLPRA